MGRTRWIGVGLLLVGAAGCGYPDFQFDGGAGGGSGGACQLVGDTGCPSGQRCTLVTPGTGTAGCVALAAMPLAPYAACSSDTQCPMGTWCDGRTDVCMPFCASSADCHGNDCTAAHDASGNTVPGGASVCVANCDPVTAAPCGSGATCAYDAKVGDMDCFFGEGYGVGKPCEYLNDCAPGLVCTGICAPWCDLDQQSCSGIAICSPFCNLAPTYMGVPYGYCM